MIKWKTLQIIPLSKPMWAVYYDEDKDELFTDAVLCLALEEPDPESSDDGPEYDREVHPFTLQDSSFIGFEGSPLTRFASNLLGYSYQERPPREGWQSDIDRYLKKKEVKEGV